MKTIIAGAIALLVMLAVLPALANGQEIEKAAEKFLTSVPDHKMFLMPIKDLAAALKEMDAKVAVLDIRPPEHFNNGHIKGSMHIPLPMLVKEMKKIPAGKKIAVVCALDTNSAFAVAVLRMMGHDAWIVDGGIGGWVKMGMPLEK